MVLADETGVVSIPVSGLKVKSAWLERIGLKT